MSLTKEIASSKEEYLTVKSSGGTPSLMDEPRGEDRSRTILREPSFLGAEPKGEQWKRGKGGK